MDETKAAKIAGNKVFVGEGEAAQARAVVLLENKSASTTGQALLPITAKNKKVYLCSVTPKVAEAAGFTVVTDPAKADPAIIRGSALRK